MKASLLSLSLVLAASVLTVVATSASAESRFEKRHPRRNEVLKREHNEVKKNDEAAADGKITKAQDRKLDHQDAGVKREEQEQAKENGGHITKAEQRKDNRQEDRINRERSNMEKRDAGKSTPPAATAPVSAPATAPVSAPATAPVSAPATTN